MNTKSFILAGLAGGVVDWLLGWLFYGILFASYFPQPDTESNAMIYITFGCFTFGFFISYLFSQWAGISTFLTGLKAGAVIGLFTGLIANFFRLAEQNSEDFQLFAIDLIISIIMAAIVGGVVGLVIGKQKK